MKYKDWLNEWLEIFVKPSTKNKTFLRYQENAKLHIIPYLGDYELNRLNIVILQKFIIEMLQNGNLKTGGSLAPNSVNVIITVIQCSLNIAQKIGLCKKYFANKIIRPKMIEKNIICFSSAEQRKIEKAVINSRNKMFGIILCLYTGIRIGELIALEWSDVDLVKCELSITKTCYDGKNENGKYCQIIDKPKTLSSIRVIPFPKQILNYLKEIKKISNSKYVISNVGNIISIRSYQKSFANLLKRLKIQHRGFHALRHTFATRALECGMDVKTLSEILGHKNPSITINRYVHSMMEHKKKMIDKLGGLVKEYNFKK